MYIMRGRKELRQVRAAAPGDDLRQAGAQQGIHFTDGPYTTRFFPIRGGHQAGPGDARPQQDQVPQQGPRTHPDQHLDVLLEGRGQSIATKLLNMAHAGRINIIYGAPSRQIADGSVPPQATVINLWDSRWDFNEGRVERGPDAQQVRPRPGSSYRGYDKKWVVMTGSPNWVHGSRPRGTSPR